MKRQKAATGEKLKVPAGPTNLILVVVDMDSYGGDSYYHNPDATKVLPEKAGLFSSEAGVFEQDTSADLPATINGWTRIDSDDVERLTSESWCQLIFRYV